jgi:hypothetical protein
MTSSEPIPRFIVGLPRAGTTWMCQSLNRHPDVMAFGETMFWGKSYVPPAANGRHDLTTLERVRQNLRSRPLESTLAIAGPGGLRRVSREQLNTVIDRALAQASAGPTPAQLFTRVARAIAAAEHKTDWVEKTPHHLLYANRILQSYPDARFIVMMRAPYSFLRSYKNQKGHAKSEASRKRFERRYHPVGGALVWRNSWRAAQSLLARAPGNSMLVRLEDIEKDPAGVMRRVHEFLQLRAVEDTLAISSRINSAFEGTSGADLTAAEIAWMNLIAGADIQAAGYLPQPSRAAAALLSGSAAALPVWALRMAWDLRQTTSGSVTRHALRWAARGAPQISPGRAE